MNEKMLDLRVTEINSQDEFEEFMDALNKETKIIFDNAYRKYLSFCENDDQRTIFKDWWNGTPVSTDEYASKFSKEDNYTAGGIILEACSNGFG